MKTDKDHSQHLAYRADIDGLRAVAILSVVLYHASATWLPGGYAGVDVFFVISGYLITGIIAKNLAAGTFSFGDFYQKRVRRIFPALVTVLAATFAGGWYLLLDTEMMRLGKHMLSATLFISNFTLLGEQGGYFDVDSHLKPLLHLWSLAIEEQFYLIWPLLLFITAKCRSKLIYPVIAVFGLSMTANLFLTGKDAASAFYLPVTRFWELSAGALLVLTSPEKFLTSRCRNILAFVGVALIAITLVCFPAGVPYPGWRAIFPVAGSAALIAAGSHAWVNRRILASKPAVFIGFISYPLYLWHWPLLSALHIVGYTTPPMHLIALAIAAAFALSALTYYLIEKPLRFGGWNKNAVCAVLCLALLTLGGMGQLADSKDGFPQRLLSPQARAAYNGFDADASDCKPFFNKRKRGSCRFSDAGGPPSVVMIGDSHAAAYHPGIAAYYKKKGVSFASISKAGCPPLIGSDSYDAGDASKKSKCKNIIRNGFDWILSSTDVKTVILAARWPLYLPPTGKEKTVTIIRTDDRPDLQDQKKQYETLLSETLSKLHQAGKKVVLLSALPELTVAPNTCIARPFAAIPVKEAGCDTARDKQQDYFNQIDTIIGKAQRAYPDITVFDPKKTLCDTQQCRAMIDGGLAYSDERHLSKYGAYRVFERFED